MTRNTRQRRTRKYRGGDRVANIQVAIRTKEQEIQALRDELKTLQPNTNDPVAKFRKMQKMGVPEPAIRQKMGAEGINASLLFGGPSAPVRSALPFALGNLGKTLKKTVIEPKAPETTQKPKEKSIAQQLAEQAKNQLGKLKPVGRPQPKRNFPESNPIFSQIKQRPLLKQQSVQKQQSAQKQPENAGKNRNKYGELPPGWKVFSDEEDTWYKAPSGETQWDRPVFSNNQGPLPKGWKMLRDDEDTWYQGPTGQTQWDRPQ